MLFCVFLFCFVFVFWDKKLELLGGGSVINGPTPSCFRIVKHLSWDCQTMFLGSDANLTESK